jgi:hypothetical protein
MDAPSRRRLVPLRSRTPSLLAYIGHPAYGLDTLRADLDRFTFLLGGSDGEDLFGSHQP